MSTAQGHARTVNFGKGEKSECYFWSLNGISLAIFFGTIRWILDREGGREMLRGVAVIIIVRSCVLSLGLGRADCLHKTEEVIS